MNPCAAIALLLVFSNFLVAQQANIPWERIAPEKQIGKKYFTSFETESEITAYKWYITPQAYLGTSWHSISNEKVFNGSFAHKAYMQGTNAASTLLQNNNHRAYPTFQFHKSVKEMGGAFVTPCYLYLHVYLDVQGMLGTRGTWFSLATLSADASDSWNRVVLVNVGQEGFLHTMHVPDHGKSTWLYQNQTKNSFPMRKWVKVKIYIDFDARGGIVAAWQDGVLMSVANVNGGNGKLEQAHFGLYAPPELSSGTVYNDDFTIFEANGTGIPRSNANTYTTASKLGIACLLLCLVIMLII